MEFTYDSNLLELLGDHEISQERARRGLVSEGSFYEFTN